MTDFPAGAVAPSYGVALDKQYRVLSASFGDGYTQRAGDGLNNITEVWNMVWENLTSVEKDTIVDFCDQQQGYLAFNFTAPGESAAKKWIAKSIKVTPLSSDVYNITATFERVYDL